MAIESSWVDQLKGVRPFVEATERNRCWPSLVDKSPEKMGPHAGTRQELAIAGDDAAVPTADEPDFRTSEQIGLPHASHLSATGRSK